MTSQITVQSVTLTVVEGDITAQAVDIIVNAANSGLRGGGGVDGAIHRAAGPELLRECEGVFAARGPCPAGAAVITGAGALNASHVVHAVGPVWSGGTRGEAQLLASAYATSLDLAEEAGAASVAFPAISTGAYRFPKGEAGLIAVGAGVHRARHGTQLSEIRFVQFSSEDRELYEALLEEPDRCAAAFVGASAAENR